MSKRMSSKEKADYIKRLLDQGLSLEEAISIVENEGKSQDEMRDPKMRAKISWELKKMGVPAHLSGYEYLISCVEYIMEHGRCSITKELYPEVAKKHKMTSSKVERAIRHVVEVAFDRADPDTMYNYFGSSVDPLRGRPTNTEFIFTLVEYLKNQ